MKKVLLFLCVLLPTIIKAQNFYEPNELRVELLAWPTEGDVDYLVQNGKPVSWTFEYGAGQPLGFNVFATYAHRNKFITLSFTNDNRIYLCNKSNIISFDVLFGEIFGLLQYMPYFSGFNYEKIVYDIWWDRILIPIGTDQSSGNSYAISVYFNNSSSAINSITSDNLDFDEDNVEYYDLRGNSVDIEKAKGQILIKTDGRKSEKFINR